MLRTKSNMGFLLHSRVSVSKVNSAIFPELTLVRDFTHVETICNFSKYPIKTKQAMLRTRSNMGVFGTKGQVTAKSILPRLLKWLPYVIFDLFIQRSVLVLYMKLDLRWAIQDHWSSGKFNRTFMGLADNLDRHQISNEFAFGPDRTWVGCCIPSFSDIGHSVLKKKIFKCFYHLVHAGHRGHVTATTSINLGPLDSWRFNM